MDQTPLATGGELSRVAGSAERGVSKYIVTETVLAAAKPQLITAIGAWKSVVFEPFLTTPSSMMMQI